MNAALEKRGQIVKLETVTRGTRVTYEGLVEKSARSPKWLWMRTGNRSSTNSLLSLLIVFAAALGVSLQAQQPTGQTG